MASSDTLHIINHYKKEIDKLTGKPEYPIKYEDRLLHCMAKLHKLPVTVNHLQLTGVGKTVNALRKVHGKKGLSEAAKALVAKWKAMVLEEDLEEERKAKEAEKNLEMEEDSMIQMSYSPENNGITDSGIYLPSKIGSEMSESDGYTPGTPNGIEIYCYSPSKKLQKTSKDDKTEEKSRHSDNQKRDKEKERKCDKNSSHSKSSSSRHEHKKSSHRSSSSSHSKSKSSSSSKSKNDHSSSSTSTKSLKSEPVSAKRSMNTDDEDDDDEFEAGTSFEAALNSTSVKKSSSSSSKKKPKIEKEDKMVEFSNQVTDSGEAIPGPSHLNPLDPQMFSNLSVPTPNYKPHHNPVIMDSPECYQVRKKEQDDALALMMTNKNSRTKVYSGVKTGLVYVPSLYEITCRVLKSHFDVLEYTGGVPYDLLKPVIDHTTPSQLYRFEHYNPYVVGDTDHLWKFHVSKEFRGEKRLEMETWRDMYLRCVDERERKYKSVKANIQKSIDSSVPVRQTKLAYVDVVKPPRNVRRAQEKNGTAKPIVERLLGKENPDAVRVPPPPPSRPVARVNDIPPHMRLKPKVAPLMQKTLKSIKQIRFKR